MIAYGKVCIHGNWMAFMYTSFFVRDISHLTLLTDESCNNTTTPHSIVGSPREVQVLVLLACMARPFWFLVFYIPVVRW